MAKQRGNCALCDSPLEEAEADHICEVANQVKGSVSQWQMLCLQCHREKSDSSLSRPDNPIASHFSPFTYEAFVRAPRPAQAVFCPNVVDPRQQLIHVDARRCRRNCLVESTYPFPVYCAHDEIKEADGNLGDYNWIDIGVPKTRAQMLAQLPYDGPRWYCRQATQWLMRARSWPWPQVTWEDIKLSLIHI